MPVLTPSQDSNMTKSKDYAVPYPGSDGISSLSWSPTTDHLVSSNWDSTVSLWDVRHSGSQVRAIPKAQVFHDNKKPSLCTCFSSDGKAVISGGVDNAVRCWDVESGVDNTVPMKIGVHEKPVKTVANISYTNRVASGSWDQTVKFWDKRSSEPCCVLKMPERVYAMDCVGKLLAVGTADNQTALYDVSSSDARLLCYDHTLSDVDKMRCVAIAPDEKSFVISGICGQTKVYDLKGGNSMQLRCFFKSHCMNNKAYQVNSLSFKKGQSGDVLAIAGSDGKVVKYKMAPLKYLTTIGHAAETISCAAFNTRGSLMAYASSYDWSKGSMHSQKDNDIFIHIDDN